MTDTFQTVTGPGGVRLRVHTSGAGAPVLLLHGFPDSLHMWDDVTPRLVAAGRRVVAYDQRGFGESDAPQGRVPYRIDTIVEDAVAVLDALGISEPIDVIGHDWGALVGWALCLSHPERVRRYVALSVGHPKAYATSGWEQKRKGLYVGFFQLRGIAERTFLARKGKVFRAWAPEHPDLDGAYWDIARPGRLTAGLTWYRANVVSIFTRRWARSTVPTLGILGVQDKYLSEDQMTRSGALVDAPWRYVRIDDAGHWLAHEKPEQIVELALDWFEQTAQSETGPSAA